MVRIVDIDNTKIVSNCDFVIGEAISNCVREKYHKKGYHPIFISLGKGRLLGFQNFDKEVSSYTNIDDRKKAFVEKLTNMYDVEIYDNNGKKFIHRKEGIK